MRTITRADIVSALRDLLSDDQAEAALITRAANWFVDELCNNNHLRIMEASTTMAGVQADTTLDFPTDLVTRINIYLTVPQIYDMENGYISYGDFMKGYANFATATQAQAQIWTDYGNAMRFAAPLNAAHTFHIDYLREPVKMAADADICEIPGRYEELIYKGTLEKLMKINEDYDYASQELEGLEPLRTTFIRNESRGGGKTRPTIIRTGRGHGSWNAARDFQG